MSDENVEMTQALDTKDTPDNSAKNTIYVKVYAPYKVYYEGEANSISAASQTGRFDILPQHHNFITLLVACDVVIRTSTHEETIRIQGGIMHVKADRAIIFLDI